MDKTNNLNKKSNTNLILLIFLLFFLVGSICLLLSNLGFFTSRANAIQVDATITKVHSQNGITFTYYFNGVLKEASEGTYIFTYKVGKVIKILIDSKTGAFIQTIGGSILSWIAFIFMALISVTGICIITINHFKEKNAKVRFGINNKTNSNVTSLNDFESKLLKEDEQFKFNKNVEDKKKNRYIFKQVNKSIINYELFDENNNVVYFSKRKKYTFLKGNKVEFTNNFSKASEYHQISLVVSFTPSYTNSNSSNMPFMFRMDGLKVWNRLDNLKIKINGDLNSGTVIYNDANIGTYQKIPFDKIDFSNKKRSDIEVNCNEEYLNVMFLAMFVMSYPTFTNVR